MWRATLAVLPLIVSASEPTYPTEWYDLKADVSSETTVVSKTTTNGPITGRLGDDGIERYFGIPTAEGASGNNRLKAPQPISWTDPIETVVATPCINIDFSGHFIGQEDCISVDIMTPSGGSGLPVFSYVHGGGFVMQDPPTSRISSGYYQKASGDETRLAVTVFHHYRLGGHGFIAHPGLSAETSYGGSGNWGVLDCITNLQWIQDNIATFGGDPTLVTLVGESGGGALVMMLLASPLTAGMFKHAIAESPYILYKAGALSMEARYGMTTLFLEATGCGGTEITSGSDAAAEVACLRSESVSGFYLGGMFAAYGESAFDATFGEGAGHVVTYNSIQVWPVVDGYALTMAPYDAWASGISADIVITLGHNADEYTSFYGGGPSVDYLAAEYVIVDQLSQHAMNALSLESDVQEFVDAHLDLADSSLDELDAFYSDIADDFPNAVQKGTEAWLSSQQRLIASHLIGQSTRVSGTVYKFVFGGDMPDDLAAYGLTGHETPPDAPSASEFLRWAAHQPAAGAEQRLVVNAFAAVLIGWLLLKLSCAPHARRPARKPSLRSTDAALPCVGAAWGLMIIGLILWAGVKSVAAASLDATPVKAGAGDSGPRADHITAPSAGAPGSSALPASEATLSDASPPPTPVRWTLTCADGSVHEGAPEEMISLMTMKVDQRAGGCHVAPTPIVPAASNAVFTLVRGDDDFEVASFLERTACLQAALGESAPEYDHIIFHSGKLEQGQPLAARWASATSGLRNARIVDVREYGAFNDKPAAPLVPEDSGYSLGYHHMCHFMSMTWFKALSRYEYAMRVDQVSSSRARRTRAHTPRSCSSCPEGVTDCRARTLAPLAVAAPSVCAGRVRAQLRQRRALCDDARA